MPFSEVVTELIFSSFCDYDEEHGLYVSRMLVEDRVAERVTNACFMPILVSPLSLSLFLFLLPYTLSLSSCFFLYFYYLHFAFPLFPFLFLSLISHLLFCVSLFIYIVIRFFSEASTS